MLVYPLPLLPRKIAVSDIGLIGREYCQKTSVAQCAKHRFGAGNDSPCGQKFSDTERSPHFSFFFPHARVALFHDWTKDDPVSIKEDRSSYAVSHSPRFQRVMVFTLVPFVSTVKCISRMPNL